MPVATIAKLYLEMGESLENIAQEYDLPLESVDAAIAYYYDHREEMDRHTAESEAYVEQMKRNSPPSPLQEKLRAIRDR
jgi:pyrroloquinoline quinone (PQQ) biosynthesis protein C